MVFEVGSIASVPKGVSRERFEAKQGSFGGRRCGGRNVRLDYRFGRRRCWSSGGGIGRKLPEILKTVFVFLGKIVEH